MRVALTVLAAAFCTACFGTPTPLAPGVSGSVGAPHHGVLTVAAELPKAGDGFVRYRPNGPNNWGNPRLVHLIETAAKHVHDVSPGPPLVVGDLSGHDGGKIERHESHRTGRDVDLPWFVTTAEGVAVQTPGFVNIGADGLAKVDGSDGYLRLDVPREWLLVKTLLTSPDAEVQWMFCSTDVEGLLIDYARARGEPPELVWHAETVLIQPEDSLPHDDHIHLRLACTPEEAVLGCEGGGPRWDWLPPLPASAADDDEAIYRTAKDDPPPPEVPEEPDGVPGG